MRTGSIFQMTLSSSTDVSKTNEIRISDLMNTNTDYVKNVSIMSVLCKKASMTRMKFQNLKLRGSIFIAPQAAEDN